MVCGVPHMIELRWSAYLLHFLDNELYADTMGFQPLMFAFLIGGFMHFIESLQVSPILT